MKGQGKEIEKDKKVSGGEGKWCNQLERVRKGKYRPRGHESVCRQDVEGTCLRRERGPGAATDWEQSRPTHQIMYEYCLQNQEKEEESVWNSLLTIIRAPFFCISCVHALSFPSLFLSLCSSPHSDLNKPATSISM